MSPKELIAAGYNVELGYKAYIPVEELQDLQEQMPPESNEAYYTRNFFVTQCVLVSISSSINTNETFPQSLCPKTGSLCPNFNPTQPI